MRIAFGLLVLAGCAVAQVVTNEQAQDTLLVLQMGACERRCPVYKLTIYADGSAVYDGRHYVKQAGLVKTKISLDALGKLIAEAGKLRFFETTTKLADCAGAASDGATAILTISNRGKSRTLVHFRGCPGDESEKWKQFEDRIVTALQAGKWIR